MYLLPKISFFIFILLFFNACMAQEVGAKEEDENKIYIVVVKEGNESRFRAIDYVRANFGVRPIEIYKKSINGFSIKISPSQAEKLRLNSEVRYVEKNGVLTGSEARHVVRRYSNLDLIDQREGANGVFWSPNQAKNSYIFILDSGINSDHQDFLNGSGQSRVVTGYNALSVGSAFSDCSGHGTHVAGVAAGNTTGVAKKANLISIKIANCNAKATFVDTLEGIEKITDLYKSGYSPAVVNFSYSGYQGRALQEAISNSKNAGLVYVASAGNDDRSDACDFDPGSFVDTITVAATNKYRGLTPYTNIGRCVDIYAPGGARFPSNTSNYGFESGSGTSFAAPLVAGTIATLLSKNSDLDFSGVKNLLQRSATKNSIAGVSGFEDRFLYTSASRTLVVEYCLERNSCRYRPIDVRVEGVDVSCKIKEGERCSMTVPSDQITLIIPIKESITHRRIYGCDSLDQNSCHIDLRNASSDKRTVEIIAFDD